MSIDHLDHVIWHYFLWGYVKSQGYKNNPRTLPELNDEYIRVINYVIPNSKLLTSYSSYINVVTQNSFIKTLLEDE